MLAILQNESVYSGEHSITLHYSLLCSRGLHLDDCVTFVKVDFNTPLSHIESQKLLTLMTYGFYVGLFILLEIRLSFFYCILIYKKNLLNY